MHLITEEFLFFSVFKYFKRKFREEFLFFSVFKFWKKVLRGVFIFQYSMMKSKTVSFLIKYLPERNLEKWVELVTLRRILLFFSFFERVFYNELGLKLFFQCFKILKKKFCEEFLFFSVFKYFKKKSCEEFLFFSVFIILKGKMAKKCRY